jgi:hypothetical protein
LAEELELVDYFPSFEIIANPWSNVDAYKENRRSVKDEAVARVMDVFFAAHERSDNDIAQAIAINVESPGGNTAAGNDVVCEDAVLDVFADLIK